MKTKKCERIVFIVVLLIITTIVGLNFTKSKKEIYHNIDELLESDAYSYLSPKVIDYIKDYYEETGMVLLTEKNKQKNTPYLNPEFITYLDSDENKDGTVIPNETISDYSLYDSSIDTYSSTKDTILPSSFDLRNVDGKNYVTSIKNQGSEGLCWAYAINSYLESILLIKDGKAYDFSEHQLGYAVATNGVAENKKIFSGNSILFDGNDFNSSLITLLNNFGFVDQKWDDSYQDAIANKSKLEPNDIYNYDNSLYQVDETVDFPVLDFSQASDLEKQTYLAGIKKYIMQGGAWINLRRSPDSSCGINTDNGYLYYNNGDCGGDELGHALHIIGWDDDYSYNICSSDDKTKYSTDISNCSSENLISGKGAWILKNSWGENVESAYVYAAYESFGTYINAIKSLSKKNWDNFYNYSYNDFKYRNTNFNFKEKVVKVKVRLSNDNTEYKVYLTKSDEPVIDDNAILIDTIKSDFGGYYNIDLKDKDIIVDANKYKVMISYDYYDAFDQKNKNLLFFQDSSFYTTDIDENSNGYGEDLAYEPTFENDYNFTVKCYVRGIPNNSLIDFVIKDSNGNKIDYSYTIKNNFTFANRVFADLKISKDLPKGTYSVEAVYNNNVIGKSKITIDKNFVETFGDGSFENPYQISTPVQLDLIRYNPDAAYILTNDIDLTYDTTSENGLYYHDGQGWEPISSFTGYLDGQNHKIIGMNITNDKSIDNYDEDKYSSGGLFSTIGYSECKLTKCGVTNLHFSDVRINGNFFEVGALAGAFGGNYYYNLSNISIDSGSINNTYDSKYINVAAAGVIGKLRQYVYSAESPAQLATTLSNIYNAATVNSVQVSGGIVGIYQKFSNKSGYIILNNFQNVGSIYGIKKSSGIIGAVDMDDDNTENNWNRKFNYFNNFLNSGKISGDNCISNFYCIAETQDYIHSGKIKLTNLYGIMNTNYETSDKFEVEENNVKIYTSVEMKDKNLYNNWENFDSNWAKLDDRLPILKIADFKYTKTENIVMNVNDKIKLDNYIYPVDRINNSAISILDNDVVKYDDTTKTLTALKEGKTIINIMVDTDGYEGEIEVVINSNLKIDEDSKKVFLNNPITLADYKKNIDLTIKIYNNNEEELSDNDYVGTGYKTEVFENDKLIKEYVNVLFGDVNGDAKVDISDVAKIYAIVMETTQRDNLSILAGDNNNDNTIDISDVALVYSKIMNG